ncbi:MAG: glycosyltransferase family 39 protein [Pseudomonadota bacterium]
MSLSPPSSDVHKGEQAAFRALDPKVDQRTDRRRALSLGRMYALVAAFAVFCSLPGLFALPPLDRDESRFAQATAQMLETGDYVRIQFQDDERNKKPVGIHWLQATSVKAFSSVEAREIWAYRLPSVLGITLACLFIAAIAGHTYGPLPGLVAGLLLASAPVAMGEATIAKTDAMLLAAITAAQGTLAFLFLRRGSLNEGLPNQEREPAFVVVSIFWIALAVSILIKGPIGPLVSGLTIICLKLRYPKWQLIRSLKPHFGVAILAIIVMPWLIGIGIATEGRFFAEALGGDMAGKIGTSQEHHGGPPGYHFVLVWFLLWPAAALLPMAAISAWKRRHQKVVWFLISWILPAWLIFEVTATKLPHYTLPLYPALILLTLRTLRGGVVSQHRRAHRVGLLVYGAVSLLAISLLIIIPAYFNAPSLRLPGAMFAALITGLCGASLWLHTHRRPMQGTVLACVASACFGIAILQFILPSIATLTVSQQLNRMIDEADLHALHDGALPTLISGYREPSAVFLLGTETGFAGGEATARRAADERATASSRPRAIAIEERHLARFEEQATLNGLELRVLGVIKGLNYSNGDDIQLTVYRVEK